MMKKAIKDCSSSSWIAEDQSPFARRPVTCDDSASTFVSLANELEEQSRAIGVERKVAELINDQQFKFLKLIDFMNESSVLFLSLIHI